MKKYIFLIFLILTSSLAFAIPPGDECSENSDCPQLVECKAVNNLCENGYCVFRKIGTRSCVDFKHLLCGDSICGLNEKERCPEDCKESKVFKALPIIKPDIITRQIESGPLSTEIIFEVMNRDPNHKLEGYLSCNLPDDVTVSKTNHVGNLQGFVMGDTFILDSAPLSQSMSFEITRIKEGVKLLPCNVNYVLFKDDKGYVTENNKYISSKTYQQIAKTIKIGKELPPCDTLCKLKNWLFGLVYGRYFALELALTLLLLFLIRELKSYTFKTSKGYVYFRIRKNSMPGWVLDKVKQNIKAHHPFSLRKKLFYYKDKEYHYLVTKDFLGVYRYYRRKRGHGPIIKISIIRILKSKVLEFLTWWATFSIGVWLATKVIPLLNIPYKFVIVLLIGIIIEAISKIMQIFRYHSNVYIDKKILFWILIHSLSYLLMLYLVNSLVIKNMLLQIVLIGLGLTIITHLVWKIRIRTETGFIISIIIFFVALLYFTKGFPGLSILLKNLMRDLAKILSQKV